ncbi:MarR family winged helix-turn-helix transcriptional regulator [Tropicibacter oceani]|uniref:MarR family transcriptional regulator n=1 Tax=Tropicibacter oceani TaxID=3058420 RepID=A0ABY8QHJ8_9RHOB|nr:MarR family transcriptional regulator [Tropicibacter oceani]WGW04115.1 MarR family transcriptional regulator [Tropicibacter oceani]
MQADQHRFHGLLHSAELVEAELRRRLSPLGLQPRQARVIEAMARIGPVSQAVLASEFQITSASMSTMTDRLLAAGYISRGPDPASRRQNVLELTDKGRAQLAGIEAAWDAVDDMLAAALGQNANTFFDLARQVRDGLGGTVPGS